MKKIQPCPASEKLAEDFLLDCLGSPLTGLLPPEHEEGLQDDLYQLIRYGVAEYDPETKRIRIFRKLSKKEQRAFWRRVDAENP
jgi:hypothetical protein